MGDRVNQAEFARMQGWSRSHVTGLKQAGRLVMEDGKVLVDESLARIEATKDPNREDVAKRHAVERDADALPDDGEAQHDYQKARAKKEYFLAKQAEAEYQERIQLLVKADDVKRAFAAQWTQLRISMDHLRDQISAELAGMDDADQIHATMGEHFEQLQSEVCRNLQQWAETESKS